MNIINLALRIVLSFIIGYILAPLLALLIFMILTKPEYGFANLVFLFIFGSLSNLLILPTSIIVFLVIRKIVWFSNSRITLVLIMIILLLYGAFTFWSKWDRRVRNEKNQKITENQANTQQKIYQDLTNKGYFNKPKYLPPGNYQIIEEKQNSYSHGYTVIYSCNKNSKFDLNYEPLNNLYRSYISNQISRASSNNYYYTQGDGIFEVLIINGRQSFYHKARNWNMKARLVWENDKSMITLSTYDDCDLPKEEMIKIAKSID